MTPDPTWTNLRPHIELGLLLFSISVFLVLAGTLGFHWIEGSNLFDSFYMTMITLTTIGYGEVFELSRSGRIFNTFLILSGVGFIFVSIGIFTHQLLQLELDRFFEKRKARRMVDRMRDHYIVCGLGRVGRGVVEQLQKYDEPVIGIDPVSGTESWARANGVPLLVGDATVDEVLQQAGAERARGLVAATSSDAQNVYITLSAREINPNLRIVARAASDHATNKLTRSGAHSVFTPYEYTGYRMAQALLRPEVSNFIDLASAMARKASDIDVEEYHVRVGSPWENRTLSDLDIVNVLGVILLAVSKSGEILQFNPSNSTRLEAGDVLIAMGRRKALREMHQASEA